MKRSIVLSRSWRILGVAMLAYIFAIFISLVAVHTANAATKYVALGDSYAAGFGADTNQYQGEKFWQYDPATVTSQNGCYRASNNAYAPQVAAAKGYTLTFAACQGATTDNILSVAQYPQQQAQINYVTADTGLVTLQIGGNDAGFANVVTCIITSNCTSSSSTYQASLAVLQNQLPAKLDAVYAAIKSHAPNARIAAVDYAPLLPQTYADAGLCAPYMTASELTLAQNFESLLNQQIKAAADRAGATYINTNYTGSPFLGKDWVGLSKNLCSASAGSAGWSLRYLTNGTNVSFHPTAYGQQFYAQIINASL